MFDTKSMINMYEKIKNLYTEETSLQVVLVLTKVWLLSEFIFGLNLNGLQIAKKN